MSEKPPYNIRFRTLKVINDYNREILGIDINTGISSSRVICYLNCLAEYHGYPKQIRVDNGSVFTDCASAHRIHLNYIEPGCHYQEANIKRFNPNEVLDCYLFNNLNEVSRLTEEWIEVYNAERPHDSLNDMTPVDTNGWLNDSTMMLF